MDKEAVLSTYFQRDLSYRFDEGLGLDVTYRSSDLRDYHVSIGLLADTVYELLDLVRNVRNNLNGRA